MALPQGINFRRTSGFVTDVSPENFEGNGTNVVTAPTYPRTTAQGNTVGWEGTNDINARDRNAGTDRRLAGLHASEGGTGTKINDFRIDLPSAGDYKVRIAAGDADYSWNTKVELFDTSSSLGVLCTGSTGAANSFKDASNATLTAANWPGSNALVTKTFATTICRFRVGDGATHFMPICHIYIEAVGGGTTPKTATLTDSLSGGELV